MEVDGMFTWGQIVQAQIDGNPRPVAPDGYFANGFTLAVFHLHFGFGFGSARQCGEQERKEQSDCKIAFSLHSTSSRSGTDYNESGRAEGSSFCTPASASQLTDSFTKNWSILRRSSKSFLRIVCLWLPMR